MERAKKLVALWTILSLALAFFPVSPRLEGAQLLSVSDTITDSKPGATANHTIQFTIQTTIPSGGSIDITLPSGFNWNGASGTCPFSGTFSTTTSGVRCTGLATTTAPATGTVAINDVVNASAEGSYLITIATKDSSGGTLDTAELRIAIVSGVTVTAHVPALLTFQVKGVNAGTVVESGTTNVTSTPTTIDFGTVEPGTHYLAAQKLVVYTNATFGFTVKVWQDQNLTNAMGGDIDKFSNGTSPPTPAAWVSPSAIPGQENTYGHFGLRTDDDPSTGGLEFDYGSNYWIGFAGDGPNYQREVMRSNRPTAGEGDSQGYGWDYVEYKLEISALQEAGDYSNILTYVCTPTY
jgi:hypothetical protein